MYNEFRWLKAIILTIKTIIFIIKTIIFSFHSLSFSRQQKLLESLSYQEFSARVGEEESWLSEKLSLTQSDDYGNSLAAVQVRTIH